jgi:hypothetical protein
MLGVPRLASLGRALCLGGLVALAPAAAAQPAKPAPTTRPRRRPRRPTPTPTPTPSTTPDTAPAAEANDIDALRQEYLKLRDELFASRARAATLASALYSTRIQIKWRFTSARFWGVSRAVVRLDGASVFDDTAGQIGADDAVRFDGWVAPGRHLVTVRLEAVGKDDDRFTTATESTFVVQAVAGKDLEVTIKSADDGDLPYAWRKRERGGYRLGLDVDVTTTARPDAGKPNAGKPGKPAKQSAAAVPGRRTAEAASAR